MAAGWVAMFELKVTQDSTLFAKINRPDAPSEVRGTSQFWWGCRARDLILSHEPQLLPSPELPRCPRALTPTTVL